MLSITSSLSDDASLGDFTESISFVVAAEGKSIKIGFPQGSLRLTMYMLYLLVLAEKYSADTWSRLKLKPRSCQVKYKSKVFTYG